MYIVTGLTKMNSGICMSVYDTDLNRYLRPIPPSSRFLEQNVSALELFSIVNLIPLNRAISILAPHTEDYPIANQTLQSVRTLRREEQIQFLRSISVESVHDVFGYNGNEPVLSRLWNRNYVLPGTGTKSLGTVQAYSIRVYNQNNKIRVDFSDRDGNTFTVVPYVSTEVIDPNNFTLQLRRNRENYVRLSLARQFRPNNWQFDACFLQVSCIHGY